MKTDDNGTIREMTAEEIAEYSAAAAHRPPAPEDDSARLDEIEAALMELAAIVGGDGNG